MLAANAPSKIQLPFADSGTKNTIPVPSQVGVTPGAASYTTGFPPLTFTPVAAGGVPPFGADFNGVLFAITAIQQWQSAGGHFRYDALFAAAVGGYPKGAMLVSAANDGLWMNAIDGNATDPDATDGSAANWVSVASTAIATASLSSGTITLMPAQFGKRLIVLSGSLSGNVQVVFPAIPQQWTIINQTSGAFTVTCKTASGSGVIVAPGGSANVYGDGTDVRLPAVQVGAPTQATHALQLGAFTGSNQSLAAAGYQKLPGGLILQWGSGVGSNSGGVSMSFPIAFPNAVCNLHGTNRNVVSSLAHANIYSASTTGFQISMVSIDASGNTTYYADAFDWFALGY